jgi:putative ABC transport system permease protein
MIKNYFLIALRNIRKHFGYSFINIAGLAIGMAACVLIWQHVNYEWSYDRFHENADNIYRLKRVLHTSNGQTTESAFTVHGLGPILKKDFPGVVDYARMGTRPMTALIYKESRFFERRLVYSDPSFFTLFSIPVIKGDPVSLEKSNALFLSESMAKKYFGDEDPVGKPIMVLDQYFPFKVVEGVFKDIPGNSHMKIDIIAPMVNVVNNGYFKSGWKRNLFYNYILLRPDADPGALEAKLSGIIEDRMGVDLQKNNQKMEIKLQPLKDIHLYSNILDEFDVNGDARSVYFLLVIAIFILGIAWINYINITTVRALGRAKEVGLRKVVGATRRQLSGQFFWESLVINFLAALLALIIVFLSLKYYNQISGNAFSAAIFGKLDFWLFFFLIFIIGAFLSSLYPAAVLSSFKPVDVLKETSMRFNRGNMMRKLLVVVQVAISVGLIAATLTIYNQLQFMRNHDLGFDKNQVLVLKSPRLAASGGELLKSLKIFKDEVLKDPRITNATPCFHVPGEQDTKADDSIWRELDGPGKTVFTQVTWVQDDFVGTFKIRLLAGRDFSKEIESDKEAAIINETALKLLGYKGPSEAIDTYIMKKGNRKRYKIIGVMKNYNHYSLEKEIEARVLLPTSKYLSFLALRLDTTNLQETMTFLREKWQEVLTLNPFDYYFVDEFFDRQYKEEKQFGGIFRVFTLLAIFIACSGLLALSSYVVLQRTKEVGIRKVLGATTRGILLLLTRDFIKLTLLAVCIALPLTYWGVSSWLQDFAYRIGIGWWFWVIPTILIIPIVMATLSVNVFKIASTNPSQSLRYE